MEKVLVLASVASMIDQFNMPNIKILQEIGYEVHVACNFEYGSTCSDRQILELKNRLQMMQVKCFQIDFTRNVMNLKQDITAYKQVMKLLLRYDYKFVHCHSPIGGVIGRLACHKKRIKVIYTAHGFHFFKGASIKSWILFYPVEFLLSRYTDVLITINREDYQRAKKNFRAKRVIYIPGVGVDTEKFMNVKADREEYRKQFGIPEDAIVVLSVGELAKRKNQQVMIEALGCLKRDDVYYMIVGTGELEEEYRTLAKKLGIGDKLILPGFRADIPQLLKCVDIFAHTSIREGLGIAPLEAMAASLPLLATKVNGMKDYVEDGKTGYCCAANDAEGFASALEKLISVPERRKEIGEYNMKAVRKFDIKRTNKIMKTLYQEV